ncbi:MAG: 3-ketoacyl-ACP reductase [Deltaproteobacteria bacterium]|nr:3-ketoacyl-ACP reductase [Deltaproteobacteria bacterium]
MSARTGTLEGKIAAVTGAGRGIGREIALDFVRAGAKVVVNDLGAAPDGTGAARVADDVVAEIRASGGEAVANYDSVATVAGGEAIFRAAQGAFGGLDILVNNAGILRDRTIFKMTEDDWDAVIAVHLKGHYCCTAPFARYIRDTSGTSGSRTTARRRRGSPVSRACSPSKWPSTSAPSTRSRRAPRRDSRSR